MKKLLEFLDYWSVELIFAVCIIIAIITISIPAIYVKKQNHKQRLTYYIECMDRQKESCTNCECNMRELTEMCTKQALVLNFDIRD